MVKPFKIIRPNMPRKQRRVEDGIQTKFLGRLAEAIRPDIWVGAIPNGGYRLMSEAIRLKRTGVRGGATDIFFVAPKGVSAWLETKTGVGELRDDQEGFKSLCIRNGHLWGMYRTVEEGLAQCHAWGFLKEER